MDQQKRSAKKRHRGIEQRAVINGWLFASPWLIGFAIFTVYAVCASFYYSFTKFSPVLAPKWIGFENYRKVFTDPITWQALQNTLIYTFSHMAVNITFSLCLALLIKKDFRGKTAARVLFFLPSVIPLVAGTMIWIFMLDASNGIVNKFLGFLGLYRPNWLMDMNWTKPAVILISAWGVGTTMMILLAALNEVPASYYEAAAIDGANGAQRFWHITIPSISNVMFYQMVLMVINGFQYFTQVNIILSAMQGGLNYVTGGPGNSLMMYPLYLYYNAFPYMDMGRGAAMAWLLFLIIAGITVIMLRVVRKSVTYSVGGE
ncbi:MAG: sugar ABC transporter permease [Clostridiales bacterium]|nr:sugar ABC transporter permease [Clostridiales bacterium]